MKIKNFASAQKLILHALGDKYLTESEKKFLNDSLEVFFQKSIIDKKECKKQGGVDNLQSNIECPNCKIKLPYGTATPFCKNCNQNLLFCYHVFFYKICMKIELESNFEIFKEKM